MSGESKWHKNWKEMVKPRYREVVVEKDGVTKRADIKRDDGLVIELQHSDIPPSEVEQREKHYKKMIWIFDARERNKAFDFYDKGDYYTFYWRWSWDTFNHCEKPVFLDFSGSKLKEYERLDDGEKVPSFLGTQKMFNLRKIYTDGKTGGWGYMIEKSDFIKRYLSEMMDKHSKPADMYF